MTRRIMSAIVLLCLPAWLSAQAPTSNRPSAIAAMSEPGPEATMLAGRTGMWDVVFSIWASPGAAPVVTRGIVAERTMIGPFLQETMHAAAGSSTPDFRRIDYLSFDRVEGRYKYVSLDTRFPAGIMPAWSFDGAHDGKIVVQFEALGFVGFGADVEGRLTRSDMVITMPDAAHELKQQHFIQANGTGAQWLAVQYEYSRR